MATEVLRSDTFESWRTKTNTISTDLGTKANLSANITANTSLVTAINELQSDIGVIGSLSTFVATDLVAALNELKTGSSVTISGTKTFSSNLNLSTGLAYTINGVSVLNATTLGSAVVNSSLTTVGTIGTGTWQGTIISPTYGGTGVNNATRTFTLNTGNLAITTQVGGSSVTLPASGTLATIAGSEVLTNKTITLGTNTVTGTLAQFNASLTDDDFAGLATAQTLTNKTITLGTNTITGTLAQFNTALTDDDFAGLAAAQVLSNKTFVDSNTYYCDDLDGSKKFQFELSSILANTTRTLTVPNNSGTIALTADVHYIGTTAVALNRGSGNLALTGIPSVTLPGSTSGSVLLLPAAIAGTTTITLPATSGTVVTTGDTGTVTNTMLAGSIANAKLTNSSVTFNGVAVALGGSGTITANTTNALTIGDGLSGGSFNGSAAVTIAADATIARRSDTHFIGTTSVALNRSSANLALTGISSVTLPGSTSGTVVLQPAAISGTTTITLPATSGTVVTTGDTGTVTNTMLAGSIANAKLTNSSVTVGSTTISLGGTSTSLAGLTSATFAGSTSGTAQIVASAVSGTTVLTLPSGTTGTLVTTGDTGTVTNTMLAGSIANAKLTNSSVTFNGVNVALGGSGTITANTTNALTIGSGLSGTSFNGSSAVTIAVDATVALRADTHYIGTTAVTLNRASANLGLTGISSIVFPGATSGTVTVQPSGIAGTVTTTLPATTGTLISSGDSGTVTNTMLAGSIANAKLTNSAVTVGTTAISLGATSTTLAGLTSVTSTSFVGALTGNASTATTLQTPVTINGVSFNGSTNITVTAAAGTLTGTALNSTVVTSSLTSVGTIGTGVWQGTSIGTAYTDAKIVSVTGTANQVTVANTSGAITLSLPQSIATTSNVTFAGVTATTVTAPTHTTASGNLTLTSAGGTVIVAGKQVNNVSVAVASPVPVITVINDQYIAPALTDRFSVSSDGSVVIRGDLTVQGNTTITSTTYSPAWTSVTGKTYYGIVQDNSGNNANPGDGTALKFIGSNGLVTTVANDVGGTTDTVTIGITSGGIALDRLAASSITVNNGTGITGGQVVTLGGSITITNSDRGSSQNIFKNIAVAGQTTVVADNNDDTLTLAAGTLDSTVGINITTDASNDVVTISHANTSSQATVTNTAGNVIQSVGVDTYGHVTSLSSINLDSRYLQAEVDTLATVTARGATTTGAITVNGTLTVSGDLQVNGTTTTVNTVTLDVADLNITVAKNATTAAAANGAGLTIGTITGGSPTMLYANSGDKFVFNRGIEASSIIRTGGTASQFLKADGSVDSNTYLTTGTAASTYQPIGNYQAAGSYQAADADLTAIAALSGTSGFLKKTAADTWTLDTNTYLTTGTAASTYQPIGSYQPAGSYQAADADLTAIAALAGTSGFLKKTAADTWTLDTNTYLTSYTETSTLQNVTTRGATTSTSITAASFVRSGGTSAQFLKADGSVDSSTYLTTGAAASTYQPAGSYQTADADLTAIAALSGTSGLLRKTAADTWQLDTNSYLTTGTAALTYQPIGSYQPAGSYQAADADLTAIAALTGTSGFLKKTAADTWVLDTNTYLTSYTETDTLQTVTSRGATTTTGITLAGNLTLSTNHAYIQGKTAGGVTVNLFALTADSPNITRFICGVDAGGFQWTNQAQSPSPWATLTSGGLVVANSVTAGSFVKSGGTSAQFLKADGSVDGTSYQVAGSYQPLDADLTAIAALAGTSGILKKTAADTWTLDTTGYITGNQTITLSGDVTGSGATAITSSITAGAVTLAKMATLPANTIIGNNTASPATPLALSVVQVQTLLGLGSAAYTSSSAYQVAGNYQAADGDLSAIAALTGTGILRRTADNTWSFATAGTDYVLPSGSITGNAATATTFLTARTINGVSFNGSANITVTANTTNALTIGDGLSGSSFNGSSAVTITVDATVLRTTGSQTVNGLLTVAGINSTAGIALGTNNTTLQGRTTAPSTVNLLRLTNDASNITRFISGTDAGGFQWTNQAETAAWASMTASGLTVNGTLTATSIVRSGGTSAQFLKADGSVDANTYLSAATAASTYQPLDGDLTSIASLSGTTGFLIKTAANTWALDTSTYLTTANASSTYLTIASASSSYLSIANAASTYLTIANAATTYQAADQDLTAIGALTGTSGFLEKTAANTWGLNTNVITSVQFTETASGNTNAHSGPLAFVLKGTANQVIIGPPANVNQYTLSLPQSINTAANVQFGSFGVGTAASGTAGEIRATNNITAYYSSDERLKTNIVKIDNALEKVSQIDGVTYDWNEKYLEKHGDVDGYFVRTQNSGVIAQQVEKVFPNVVADRADGYKAVRYELLVPLLIEAIKELKAEIEALKSK